MGLPDGRKKFKIGLAVLIQYRRVTDSHLATHPTSQPRCRSIKYALCISASRSKNQTADSLYSFVRCLNESPRILKLSRWIAVLQRIGPNTSPVRPVCMSAIDRDGHATAASVQGGARRRVADDLRTICSTPQRCARLYRERCVKRSA